MVSVIGLADVESAAERISGLAQRTPVMTSRTLNAIAGAEVFLKCENLQRAGAFKFRGACNALAQLSATQLQQGVVTYSSGNHAQALTLAGGEFGAQVVVVVPEDTSPAKVAAIRGYGAELISYDRHREDRIELCERIAAQRHLTIIPPYDHPHVMAGQGTAVLELLQDIGRCDAVVVPVGGGGLIAGSGVVAKALQPAGMRVVGVEPATADDTSRSLAVGHPVRIPPPDTIADGLRTQLPGSLTFAVNRQVVDEIALVTDPEIATAMRFAFERLKLVLEPSGAVGLAAVLAGRLAGVARIGVVLSGGNVDPTDFAAMVGSVRS